MPAGAALASPLPSEPDAELLALGRELDTAWAEERTFAAAHKGRWTRDTDAAFQAVCDRASEIVERIEGLPATTMEGLRVKARAISWCHDGKPVDLRGVEDATDCRLATALVRDLLAMEADHV